MQSRVIMGLSILSVAAVIFIAGWYAREYELLNGPRYALTQPLKLSAGLNSSGELPAGTVLYRYRALGEIDAFVVFVNTKRLDALHIQPSGKAFLRSPIEAY
jgi:hypothetical protein